MTEQHDEGPSLKVFERAAELFGLLSTPVRLRIVSALCEGERNVTELRELIDVSQPNISQHLNMLYRSGAVTKRRHGSQVFYRIADEYCGLVCRAVASPVTGETFSDKGLSIVN